LRFDAGALGVLQMLNQGLAIIEKVYGKEHPATAACYNNIGAVMKAGENVDALEIFNQGLAMVVNNVCALEMVKQYL